MNAVAGKQEQIIEDLLIIHDVQERLSAIVHRFAKANLPVHDKIPANRVPGCVSQVWLVPRIENGYCHFAFDADSPMVKGLVGLLCEFYQGGSVNEVAQVEPVLWERLNLVKQLTPTRQNGLRAVRAAIKHFAEQHALA